MPGNLLSAIPFGEPRAHPAGDALFRQGSENADVYLIVSGFVDLVATNAIDGLQRSVSWRGPGQLVGDSRAILGAASPVGAKTATPCVLRRISARLFLNAFGPEHNPALWHLVRARSRQLMELLHTMALFASAQARQRLEYVLWRLVMQQRGPASGGVRLTEYSPTNRELAGYIGVNPTYVPALFAALQRDGIAHRHRGVIVVSDHSRLFRPPQATAAGAEAAPWKALFHLGTPRRFDAGYRLFEQNDPAEEVSVVASGFVDLSAAAGGAGPEAGKSLSWAYTGELLANGPTRPGDTEHLTATTRTRSLLYQIPVRSFLATLGAERDPAMHDLLISQDEELAARTIDAAAVRQPLIHALEHVLWRLAEQHGGCATAAEVQLTEYSPSNSTLAGYIGTEERYLSHLLHHLKAEHIAWRGDGRLITVRAGCGDRAADFGFLQRARAS